MSTPERLARLVQVEPPPELERCVRQRLLAAVEETGAHGQNDPNEHMPPLALGRPGMPLPLAERCVYIVGLLGFGARALGATAQLVWRAVLG